MMTKRSSHPLLVLTIFTALVLFTVATIFVAQTGSPRQFLNVLTGGTGGVYYPLGGALSNIFSAAIPGTKPSVQATMGSVENLNLLQQGKGEIAFTAGDSLAFACAGDKDSGFNSKLNKLRGVAAIYPNYI